MIEVRFREDSRGRLSSLFAQGHAGWADHGEDIVCAAVSALLQGAWLGLREHARIPLEAEKDDDGRLELRWPESVRERPDVLAIVATAELAVTTIAAQYPEHVRARREPEP